MRFHELAAAALAVLLVSAGAVAAVPGDAPDGARADDHEGADEHAQDDRRDDDRGERARDDHAADANEAAAAEPGEATAEQAREDRGPPTDVPAQVPDFVGRIHGEILKHLDGGLGGAELGEAISNLTPGDGSDGSEESTPTPTPTPAGG